MDNIFTTSIFAYLSLERDQNPSLFENFIHYPTNSYEIIEKSSQVLISIRKKLIRKQA